MTRAQPVTIRHGVVVDAPLDRAFRVFTAFEPPNRVEVRFTAESGERTRVELEHRHIERQGEGWESVAAGVDGDAGWPLYLGRYASLFAQ